MFDFKQVIGLSEKEAIELAKKYNYVIRVTAEDGEYFLGTCDWREDRINVTLDRGKITSADIG